MEFPQPGRLGGFAHHYVGTGPTVAIIGDSLTVATWTGLYEDLAVDHAVKIAARFGEGFDGGAWSDNFGVDMIGLIVDEYAADPPDVAVLALGTNTVLDRGVHVNSLDRALERQARAVDALAGSCLIGVTLPLEPGASGWRKEWAERLNAELGSWADRVVDWAAAVDRDPLLLAADRVHLSDAGVSERVRLISAAVRR